MEKNTKNELCLEQKMDENNNELPFENLKKIQPYFSGLDFGNLLFAAYVIDNMPGQNKGALYAGLALNLCYLKGKEENKNSYFDKAVNELIDHYKSKSGYFNGDKNKQ